MGPTIFVLAIMGCGEAEAPCQQVAIAPARYESVEACNAGGSSAIENYLDIDYPVVVAECRRADIPMASQLRADEVKLPAPESAPRIERAVYKPGDRVRI